MLEKIRCWFRGCDLTGPESHNRIICPRCKRVYDAALLRGFDSALRSEGARGFLSEGARGGFIGDHQEKGNHESH